MPQCEVKESLPSHLPVADSAGASLGRSEAGSGSSPTSGPDANLARDTASLRDDEGSVSNPQLPTQELSQLRWQLWSQLPSQPLGPSPTTQPTAALTPKQPAHVSDHMGTCDHDEEVPSEPNPDALHLPAHLHAGQEGEDLSQKLPLQEPTAAAASAHLPQELLCMTAQMDAATPSRPAPPEPQTVTMSPQSSPHPPTQSVQSAAQDVQERQPSSAAAPHAQMGFTNEYKASAAATAAAAAVAAPAAAATAQQVAQAAAPLPEPQAHPARAVQEWSPEPRAASEGHIAQALHDAFALYAKSRSRSRDSQQQQQQQPRHLSVPNPFRVSPEALQRPSLPPTRSLTAVQDSAQAPAQKWTARAVPRSLSPEALHVLQLGIAEHQSSRVHSNRCSRSASRSRAPEGQLLAASEPCGETLSRPTAAATPLLEDPVPKGTTAPASCKPNTSISMKQDDNGREDSPHSMVCSDSEHRDGKTWLGRSPDAASEVIMMQNKLLGNPGQPVNDQRRAHGDQHLADVPSWLASVEAQPKIAQNDAPCSDSAAAAGTMQDAPHIAEPRLQAGDTQATSSSLGASVQMDHVFGTT